MNYIINFIDVARSNFNIISFLVDFLVIVALIRYATSNRTLLKDKVCLALIAIIIFLLSILTNMLL